MGWRAGTRGVWMVFGVAAQRVMSRDRAGVCPGDWTGLVCARINCMEKIPKSALLLMPFAYYHLGFRGSFQEPRSGKLGNQELGFMVWDIRGFRNSGLWCGILGC